MKKLLVTSFIVLNLCLVFAITFFTKYNHSVNQFFMGLADESLIATNDTAYTMEQKEKIKSIDGIGDVEYGNNKYSESDYNNTIFSNTISATGDRFPVQLLDESKFPLTSGELPHNSNEIIVSDQLAKQIEDDNNLNSVIGTEAEGYEIVGTYDGEGFVRTSTFDKETEDENGKFSKKTINMFSGAFVKGLDKNDLLDTEQVLSNKNLIKAGYNGDEEYILPEEDNHGQEIFDYERAKEDGLEGYEDPKTDKYGETYDDSAYIKIEDPNDMMEIKAEIVQIIPDVKFIDNTVRTFDVTDQKTRLATAAGAILVLNILLYCPWMIKRK